VSCHPKTNPNSCFKLHKPNHHVNRTPDCIRLLRISHVEALLNDYRHLGKKVAEQSQIARIVAYLQVFSL